ncbi:hypothetical protein RJT34_04495 [Clitoria ternatea]|uniref:F-box protein n=1 Tax=Clitoria ternatea TaxID=43366 RepID=A0AAN9KLE1_CLITE
MPAIRMTNSLMTTKDQIKENQGCGIIHCKEIQIGDMDSTNAYPFHLDMVEAIAGHLNIVDYLHFRASSRLFRVGAPPIEWRSTMSRCDESSLTPFFVCFEKDKTLTFVHPKHGLKYKYNINLPQDLLPECTVLYSKDGWLLLRTAAGLLFGKITMARNHSEVVMVIIVAERGPVRRVKPRVATFLVVAGGEWLSSRSLFSGGNGCNSGMEREIKLNSTKLSESYMFIELKPIRVLYRQKQKLSFMLSKQSSSCCQANLYVV